MGASRGRARRGLFCFAHGSTVLRFALRILSSAGLSDKLGQRERSALPSAAAGEGPAILRLCVICVTRSRQIIAREMFASVTQNARSFAACITFAAIASPARPVVSVAPCFLIGRLDGRSGSVLQCRLWANKGGKQRGHCNRVRHKICACSCPG